MTYFTSVVVIIAMGASDGELAKRKLDIDLERGQNKGLF